MAVGNTGTEALSAYLGQKIDNNSQSIIEDQLEALTRLFVTWYGSIRGHK